MSIYCIRTYIHKEEKTVIRVKGPKESVLKLETFFKVKGFAKLSQCRLVSSILTLTSSRKSSSPASSSSPAPCPRSKSK